MMTRSLGTVALLLAFLLGTAPQSTAQDLVYRPKNPSFGGSPANFQFMMQSAEMQRDFADDTDDFRRDPLENFEEQLQRRLLNQLSREIVGTRLQEDGVDLTEEGRFEFGDFLVEVQEGADGLSIQIFNAITGDESTITVPQFGDF